MTFPKALVSFSLALLWLFAGTVSAQQRVLRTLTWPSDYRVALNQLYARDGEWRGFLDVYARKVSGRNPVVIWYHGGNNSKENQFFQMLPLVELGLSVVLPQAKDHPDRRLNADQHGGTAHRIPVGRCALNWVVAHAEEYRFDLDRIVLVGVSRGGYSALMTALVKDDSICPSSVPVKVSAVIDFFGSTAAPMGSPDDTPSNRVETNVTPAAPPVLIIHGDADKTVPIDVSVSLDRALTKAGVAHEFLRVPLAPHTLANWTPAQLIGAWQAVERFLQQYRLLPSP